MAAAAAKIVQRSLMAGASSTPLRSPYNVFINHRGKDTKLNIASLIYDKLAPQPIMNPFLDCKSLSPGDRLFENIDAAIHECKVGVTIFSPKYCESYFCLHELALLIEERKKVIPIFWDTKPSDLRIMEVGERWSLEEYNKFSCALYQAKYTAGLAFDSEHGDWSDLLERVSETVARSLEN